MNEHEGRLCHGENSIDVHYWWVRRQSTVHKDEKSAIDETVRNMMVSMGRDSGLRKKFNMDSQDGVRYLFVMLSGKVSDCIDRLRSSHTPYLMQPGRDGNTTLSYKPIRLATVKGIPLFELVLVPVLSALREKKVSVELRIYESEPECLRRVVVGHRAGVKRIAAPGRFDTDASADRRTLDRQDEEMIDARQQYTYGERHRWFIDDSAAC